MESVVEAGRRAILKVESMPPHHIGAVFAVSSNALQARVRQLS